MQKKIILTVSFFLLNLICFAQDKVENHTLNYDPEKLKIIPDAIAAPSCGSLGLSGWLESFVTIKMPAIKPNNEPPVVIKRKTKMPVRYGCARENFIFSYNLRHR